MAVAARDVFYSNGDYYNYSWWHSTTGTIVRWVIFLAIFTLIMAYIVGGYLHAKARLRKGLQPLAYHRCFVSRRLYAPQHEGQQWPHSQNAYYPPQQNGYQNAYPMNDMPLPAYDPNRPPVYSGPGAGSKVDPSQNTAATHRVPESDPAPDYTPPSGPPPAR